MTAPTLRDQIEAAMRRDDFSISTMVDAVLLVVQAREAELTRRAEETERALAAQIGLYRSAEKDVTELIQRTEQAEAALAAKNTETERLRRQVAGYRGMKDAYLRERNAAWAELLKAERLIEQLCDDVDNGRRMAKAALTEQRERAEQAEKRLAELESAVAWQTSCLSCAWLLDASYEETVRAEIAEAAVQRVRDLHRNEDGHCSACMDIGATETVWPCPTLAALNQSKGAPGA